jgi:hypothetical protein
VTSRYDAIVCSSSGGIANELLILWNLLDFEQKREIIDYAMKQSYKHSETNSRLFFFILRELLVKHITVGYIISNKEFPAPPLFSNNLEL